MADKNYVYIKTTNNVTDSKYPMQSYNAETKKFENVLDKDGKEIPMKQVSVSAAQMEKLGHALSTDAKQYAQFSVPAYAVRDWKKKDGTVVTTKDGKHTGHEISIPDDKTVYISISEVTGQDENGKNIYDYKKNPKVKVSAADLAEAFKLPDREKTQETEAADNVEPDAPELD